MAEISVDRDTLSVEIIASDSEARYEIVVEYETENGNRQREHWRLDVEARGDLTTDWLETTLTDWIQSHEDAEAIRGFEVRKIDPARRGSNVDEEEADVPIDTEATASRMASTRSPVDVSFRQGDRIAYHVGGPDSSVYGHTTEAAVTELPPLKKQHRDPIHGKVEIDTGTDTKLIPVEWVVGLADEVEVDRLNENL